MNSEVKKLEIALAIGIILIILAPYILTRSFGLIEFNDSTGVVGDTIGGITGPICSLLGSLLIYFALKAQIDANKLIYDQFEHQKIQEKYHKLSSYITEQIKLIREDIHEFSITKENRRTVDKVTERQFTTYKGSEAVFNALQFYSRLRHESSDEDFLESNHNLLQLDLLLGRILYLLDEIEKTELNADDKNYMLSTVNYTYESRLKTVFKQFDKYRMSKVEPCKCGKRHNGLPESIFEKYDSINQKYGQ